MSHLLQVKNLSFSRNSKSLFADLNFAVNQQDRIGLVGHNGCGKSSLLQLLADQEEPDDGRIQKHRGLKWSFVEQFLPGKIAEETLLNAVVRRLPKVCQASEQYRAETLLSGLGFGPDQFHMPLAKLSGGQQNLALLARALITDPELLLMDEPGNHMDNQAMEMFKSYLKQTRSFALLMIAHDRDLLDSCTTKTWFIRDRRLYEFASAYSNAKQALAMQDAQSQKRRSDEEKEISRIRASAKRLAVWGKVHDNEDFSRKAKSMDRRADRLEAEKTFVSMGSGLQLSVDADRLNSKSMITLEGVSVDLPNGRNLVNCDYLMIRPGERVALLGKNGLGKSTTLRQLLSEYHEPGNSGIRFNPQARLFYYDQELSQLDQPLGRFDWLRQRVDNEDREVKQVLIQSGVRYRDFTQQVNTLSGGEKARMMFILMQLRRPNLAILDEPTNHIDLEGREQLEQQLVASGMTLLVTSHDRAFIEKVANRWLWIERRELQEIYDLDTFYHSLQPMPESNEVRPKQLSQPELIDSEGSLLERIEELEKLVREDKARKPKFQKPEKQRLWCEELESLWQQLEAM